MLIEAGVADGRLQDREGRDLLKRLDEFERELGRDRPDRAADRLRALAQRTNELVREGRMDPGFGQQVIDGIAAVAEAHGLRITPNQGGGDNGGGND
jgi:hypothetical protein